MGRIFYLMGKSATGKDTVYKELLHVKPELKTVVPYTTRPIRAGEENGVLLRVSRIQSAACTAEAEKS